MTLREIKDQRNKLLANAQQILLADKVDAEQRSSAQRMITDADLLEADITALDKITAKDTEERAKGTPARPVPGAAAGEEVEVRNLREKTEFRNYITRGTVSPSMVEYRDITTSTAGYLVPQGFYPNLIEARKFYGNILNIISNIDVNDGAPTKYATISDVANLLAVVGEAVAVSEVDPTAITGAIISSDFLTTGVIKVSLAELGDSAFDLDAWIRKAFGLRYYRGLSNMVTNASSSGNIGSLKNSAVVGATTAAPTVIAWSDIVRTFAALDPAYDADAKWSMNAVTRGLLLAVTDTLGRPLYIPAPTADLFDMVMGKPVVINPFMDNPTAALIPVLYGDHTAYLLRNVKPGLSIMRMNERFLDSGEIGFIGFARAGGALLQAASMNPIISLQMHA